MIPDCEDLECVVPHLLFNKSNFRIEEICLLESQNVWKTDSLSFYSSESKEFVSLPLEKPQKEDINKLSTLIITHLNLQ